ncbi:LysR family transcriptional regulator [Pyxidicoccus fallax]|uniref:LysR family transcriptional regulator n=1 Tax=Pyxidicoccus fallax TaxID=394095 RepID=A0A848LN02_9BACT|nr:LysR family transcriptional regulator [Pyxidicoccus fallax]NMO18954.1 LysR family transcriptional regulator [Pyxidicoccus fallax]NPC79453.1 LysR family transcriptional regulator [Pyxidicoccus fallax]
MRWLNYHHLLYFWTVARTGSIAAASRELYLSQPAISTQIKALETQLGTALFERRGRVLVLTEAGRKAFDYAEQIFRLGQELCESLSPTPTQPRLRVGLGPMTSKLLASHLLGPLYAQSSLQLLECREAPTGILLSMLAARELDLVLADDDPRPPSIGTPEWELLRKVDFALFGSPALLESFEFPRSLHGAPMLLPTPGSALRDRLSEFFRAREVSPKVVAECEDGALMVELARCGAGLLAAPVELRATLQDVHGLRWVGPLDSVQVNVLLHTPRAQRGHPAVERLIRSTAPAPPPAPRGQWA